MSNYLIEREVCPVCGSSAFNTLYDQPYELPALKNFLTDFYNQQGIIEYQYLEGTNYTLLQCQHCGLIFQRMIPADFLAGRIYEHWISPEAAFAIEEEKMTLKEYWNFASDFTSVLAYLGKRPVDVRVFDFGMGWGTTLSIYKGMGCQVFGNEIAQSRIEHAQKNGIINLTSEELKTMKFDYIHSYQVMEHVAEPKKELASLVERLEPDGLIRVSVPNGGGMDQFIPNITWQEEGNDRLKLSNVDPLEHINCFTYQTLLQLGQDCGLKPVRLKMPLQYQSIYQMLRSAIRVPYRYLKYRQLGRVPDIVFQKQ